jgi:hypothetical protein
VCFIDNFDRLISGSVIKTIEKQRIAGTSDIPPGGGKGNRTLIRIKKISAQRLPVKIHWQ